MKKNEKILILILALITVALIVVLIVRNVGGEKENTNNTIANTNVEEFVNVLPDGTRKNTSSKLAEAKTIDGLTISNIRLTESGNKSLILADITNSTASTKGGYPIIVTLLDKNGGTIDTMEAYIDPVPAGGVATLNAAATTDFANAYDFTVAKK